MNRTQLSEHFYWHEFLTSKVLPELRLYKPTGQEIANATRVAQVLEVARSLYGFPLRITSGGRPPTFRNSEGKNLYELLKAKGHAVSRTSQHRNFCVGS